MPQFLVEHYVARGAAVGVCTDRACAAAAELTREGHPVRHLRSLLVPEDETCFFVFEAESVEAVREAARRAALGNDHIVTVEET